MAYTFCSRVQVTQGAIYFADLTSGSWRTVVWSLVAFLIVVIVAQLLARL